MNPNRALMFARSHRSRFISELNEFLRFASVSSEPKRAADVNACATWLAGHLKKIGMRHVRLIRTQGHPLVYASTYAVGRPDRRAPTVLIYGHYDVVSAEPLEQWETSPFRPTMKGEDLYARGACDDKGQLFCHVKALECLLRTHPAVPLNVKCIFEGEEEIGSRNLLSFVDRHKELLRADVAVISDTKMKGPGEPAISYSQRGGLRAELGVYGPRQELHSGTFGGAVLNPIQALCELIDGLHDKEGRVAIPGFYDDVRNWSAAEREYMAQAGPSDPKILKEAGVEQGWGEPGYTAYERTTIRPALTLNGIAGGHAGTRIKGVIPARAIAKLSFRLVPDQDPAKVARLFREHVATICPGTVQCSVHVEAPTNPVLIDRGHPALEMATEAYRKGFGSAPVFLRSGGSIPVASAFQQNLNLPVVLMGFGLPDDRIHGPNEKFHLRNFYRGIKTSIWYLTLAAQTLGRTAVCRPRVASEWVT